jgi:branched-subunit amino acid aminotransferase/4-amino-4-deoxychorismate lyase
MDMTYPYFSRGGEVLPLEQAVVPLGDIHYAYGFGVYETIRVLRGKSRFLKEHCARLMESANIIGLEHHFSPESVAKSAEALIKKNKAENCNLKVLLIGGSSPEQATLNILCLNPLFPDRKLYRQGVHTITKDLERPFPHAKTLNMLPSYLAHRDAKAASAYEALLVNRHGCITEGTSTNVFAIKDRVIFSPPESDILLGVTRDNVLKVAKQNGFTIKEQDLKLIDISRYDNLFLTSTPAKIMPIRSVDKHVWQEVSPDLRELMQRFDNYL